MKSQITNYSLTRSTWDDKEISAIKTVADSGTFTMGEYVVDYEKQFADFFDSKFAVMVSSGSAANLLMIATLIILMSVLNLFCLDITQDL